MTRTRVCRWPGCKKPIGQRHWGCLEHWDRLPDSVRCVVTYARYSLGCAKTNPEWEAALLAATKWAKSKS